MANTKILITGANGFIGSSLCHYLRKMGCEIYGLVRPGSDRHFLDGLDMHFVFGDLRYPEAIALPVEIDCVIHSASIVSDNASEEQCRQSIYQLAVNLHEKIAKNHPGISRFVYISTSLTLGYNGLDICDKNPGQSAMFMPYTRYKKKTEDYFLEQHRKQGLPVVVLQPADVYGPRDRTSCARMLRFCERGIPLIAGSGKHLFGYCYIDNLCQAVHLACTRDGIVGKSFVVANANPITWKKFFSGLQKGMGKKQRLYIPVFLAKLLALFHMLHKKIRPGFDPSINLYRIRRITADNTYDISRTLAELGYRPDEDVDSQIAAIVSWYREERKSGFIR